MIRYLDRAIATIEAALATCAAIILLLIMAIVAADVFMRYVFNRPFSWSYDLISLYLMAALFYFALSRTFALNAHIGVDILQSRMSPGMRRVCQIAIGLVSSGLFSVMAVVCAGRTADDWTMDAVAAGAIPWPSWLSDVLVPIGAGLLALRGLVHAAAHAAALAGGPDVIPLPPLAGTAERVAFE
jgi:TRAP-type C4-dicarboxylate transport system permease small subunit